MKRILNCCASDFGQEGTPLELKGSIRSAQGRTLLSELDGCFSTLFDGVTNAEIASAFGADLLMLKRLNWKTHEFCGMAYDNPVAELRRLSGVGVGVNMNMSPEYGDFCVCEDAAIDEYVSMRPDFLSITGYRFPSVTTESVLERIEATRNRWDGFLNVHFVLSEYADLDPDRYLAFVDAGADMITMPVPGTVQGITEERLLPVVDAIRERGALVSLTTFTSQEGSDTDTVRELALSARRCGSDVFAFGDANICGTPEPEDIMAASLAMRGKRHTYVRMARSAAR